MNRRATYMYGALLPRGPKGHVDAGLGKAVSLGQPALVAPTESIVRTGTRLSIDGVEAVFQVTPGTEAPAEMNFYLPGLARALHGGELHLLPAQSLHAPRRAGARRQGLELLHRRGAGALRAPTPTCSSPATTGRAGGARTPNGSSTTQRDLYKYVHDQTLRLANHGLTPKEIAEELALPPTLAAEWHTRGYYGTLNHNAKAVYQRYLGWFDGNPANLHPLPPVEAGERYVDLAGGAEALLAKARAAFEAGDYRWVAEVVNHLVFADPDNEAARALQADALEQLGYQAESGPWRAFYLTGAQELRNRRAPPAAPRQAALAQLPRLPGSFLLDALSVRLNGPKAARAALKLGVAFTDTNETLPGRGRERASCATTRTAPTPPGRRSRSRRPTLVELISGAKTVEAAQGDGSLAIEGDPQPLADLLALARPFRLLVRDHRTVSYETGMTDTLPTAREAQVVARAATWADADQLAATLGRAFHDDPLICFLLPDEASRPQKMARLFKLLFKLGLPHGCCDVTTGCEAAALWRPPGAWHIPFYQYITNGAEFLGLFGFSGARRVTYIMDIIEKRHAARAALLSAGDRHRHAQAGQGLRRRRHPPAFGDRRRGAHALLSGVLEGSQHPDLQELRLRGDRRDPAAGRADAVADVAPG